MTRLVLQTVTPVTELELLFPLCETGHSFFRVRLTSLCETENSESLSSGETNSNFKKTQYLRKKKPLVLGAKNQVLLLRLKMQWYTMLYYIVL